ncbi:MAG: hypothetical protein M1508_09975 [Nitrospirae bacterium]|nr:hypothetical protein [Nitrospirota bacterium]
MGQLFIIKPVEFEHGKEDPFGFDYYSGLIADKYIPFSGTIRKPLYLLFVAYVNWLIRNKLLKGSTNNEDIRLRLEKLLVKCLTLSNTSHRFIIGSTFRNINPFKGNDGNWVIQNCYKIYDESARVLVPDEVIEDYHVRHLEQIKLLNDFLKRTGTLDANKRFLDSQIKQLRKKKTSMFSGNLLLSRRFRDALFRELKDIIRQKGFGKDKALIKKLFVSPSKAPTVLKHVLHSEDYPFKSLNHWFASFILAVDSDIRGEQSKSLWNSADRNYQKLSDNHGTVQRPTEDSKKHTRIKCWFSRVGDKYEKSSNFSDSGWDALVRKTDKEDHELYTFRTDALGNLLKELDPHAS